MLYINNNQRTVYPACDMILDNVSNMHGMFQLPVDCKVDF